MSGGADLRLRYVSPIFSPSKDRIGSAACSERIARALVREFRVLRGLHLKEEER